ncbi:alpha/beta fold hydrolase [Alienimonas californiensis]|uniref:Phospholipase YtpA n=1 Tax=Alienimonas californiensis TaxID=2527989 RepID=A0A517PDA3_9PLAN|nr:alpha/beta fold hydrolase [Alienimonas californiensis]QDT17357.1 Phospholipase YtpA [Alienimonas californiensis]
MALRLQTSDGVPLFCRRYDPPGPTRGAIVLCPGVRSHSGWYGWSCRRWAEAGWRVWFADRRGSGANGGPRGDVRHPDRLLADMRHVLHAARRTDPRTPTVLCGISWGGKVAATLAAEPGRCDALMLLAPGLRAQVRVGALRGHLARAAAALGRGRTPVRIPLEDPRLFTRDEAFVRFIERDPLALDAVTLRFTTASLELDLRADAAIERLSVPVLTLLAGQDEIVDNPATRRLLGRCGSPDATVRTYPAARHTLEFEPDRAAIFDEATAWLERLSPRAIG